MELRNLNTFLRVADRASFSRAAEELGYTQSTVTAQIQQLEQELGLPLFDRLGKRIALTQAGETLVVHARALVQGAENAKLALRQPGPPRGKLRLGAFTSLGAGPLPGLLRRYHMQYPEVDLEIQTGGWQQLARQLSAGRLDLVWLLGEGPVPAGWAGACPRAHPLRLAAAPGSPWARPGPVAPAQLSAAPFLFTEQGCPYRAVFEQFCARAGLQPHIFLETDSTSAILQFALNGLGVALLPGFLLEGPAARGELVPLQVEGFAAVVTSRLFLLASKWKTPAVEAFLALAGEA